MEAMKSEAILVFGLSIQSIWERQLPIAKAMGRLLVEDEARPFEVAGDEVVVGQDVARLPVQELREVLLIDEPGDFGRNGAQAETWRTSADDEGAAMAIEGQPPGPERVEHLTENRLMAGVRDHQRGVRRGSQRDWRPADHHVDRAGIVWEHRVHRPDPEHLVPSPGLGREPGVILAFLVGKLIFKLGRLITRVLVLDETQRREVS